MFSGNRLDALLQKLKQGGAKKVCVEAAHIYVDQEPCEEHSFCAQVGAQLSEALLLKGMEITKMLFVDDYHPDISTAPFPMSHYLELLEGQGFHPDEVVMESDLVKPAFCLMRTADGQTVTEGERVFLRQPRLALMTNGVFSCNILDAALYLDKFNRFDYTVTVLPAGYKDQQKNVRRMLKAFGHENFPVTNVFYDEKREIRLKVA